MVMRVDVDRTLELVTDGAPLLDVLSPSVYAKVHLPGAVNVPLESFRAHHVSHLDKRSPVVVYCFDQH